mmetsp:Transcript_56996/g.116645  ORF Transcript_56996/g.116645 Transcript_56996/m.116645 type:complete len:206 (-) Transcript_56996:1170-1787(-)|eukprot:CAMPEP_0181338180 /NCGR_PEP_ID=MMETSP1101-20121128/28496_1 /TAXON_ID=46948 /ORGANISM="Rhodomonas abbreviata, Strain Caron Lab Isolate" /LENGTH=205 /DNA_ID=CAMNT_0023448887 /DNA_START=110 /DNA_END=727 /DNA_ORIENTATION=+
MGSAPSTLNKDLIEISRSTGVDFLQEMERDRTDRFRRCNSEAVLPSKSSRKPSFTATATPSFLNAEDLGMRAIRGYAIERTASSRSSPDADAPIQRAVSVPAAMKLGSLHHNASLDITRKESGTPPKEALLRVLDELCRLRPPASALPYIKWACDECGLNDEYEKKKEQFICSLSPFDEEDEFSLEDMKADSLNCDVTLHEVPEV